MYIVLILLLSPLGYVQGMSDMLAPILYVMDNEVDAFWCFAGLMEQMVSSIYTSHIIKRLRRTLTDCSVKFLCSQSLFTYVLSVVLQELGCNVHVTCYVSMS